MLTKQTVDHMDSPVFKEDLLVSLSQKSSTLVFFFYASNLLILERTDWAENRRDQGSRSWCQESRGSHSCCSSCTSRRPSPPGCERRSSSRCSGTSSASSHGCTSGSDTTESSMMVLIKKTLRGHFFVGKSLNRNLRRIAVDTNGKREEDGPPPTSSSQRTSPVRPFAPSSS